MRDYTEADVATAAKRLARRVQAGQMSAEDAALVLRAAYPRGPLSGHVPDGKAQQGDAEQSGRCGRITDTPSTSHDTEAGP